MGTEKKAKAPKLGFILSVVGAVLLLLAGYVVYMFDPLAIIDLILPVGVIVGAVLAHYRRLNLAGGLTILIATAGALPLMVINLGTLVVLMLIFIIPAIAGGILILRGR